MRFKKGQSGNAKGRPKGITQTSWKAILEEVGQRKDPKGGGMTYQESVAITLWTKASKGDTTAASIIMDRIEGKPKQALEVDETVKILVEIDTSPDEIYPAGKLPGKAKRSVVHTAKTGV